MTQQAAIHKINQYLFNICLLLPIVGYVVGVMFFAVLPADIMDAVFRAMMPPGLVSMRNTLSVAAGLQAEQRYVAISVSMMSCFLLQIALGMILGVKASISSGPKNFVPIKSLILGITILLLFIYAVFFDRFDVEGSQGRQSVAAHVFASSDIKFFVYGTLQSAVAINVVYCWFLLATVAIRCKRYMWPCSYDVFK